MYNLGLFLIGFGGIIVFSSDRIFRKKREMTMQMLLKVKLTGLLVTIAGMILMFNSN